MAKIVGKPSADDVKRVAVAALVAALDDGKENAKKKPAIRPLASVPAKTTVCRKSKGLIVVESIVKGQA